MAWAEGVFGRGATAPVGCAAGAERAFSTHAKKPASGAGAAGVSGAAGAAGRGVAAAAGAALGPAAIFESSSSVNRLYVNDAVTAGSGDDGPGRIIANLPFNVPRRRAKSASVLMTASTASAVKGPLVPGVHALE